MQWFKNRKTMTKPILTTFAIVGWACALGLGYFDATDALAQTPEQERLAIHLATLFRAGRAVISENQKLINDETKGDKGLTAEKVVGLAKENYKKTTNKELATDRGTLEGKLTQAMLESMKEVMDKAQDVINKPGVGFKGFLPATFGHRVAEAFKKKVGETASIKLTAPKSYVRNRANAPDAWEDQIIESKLKANDWTKNKAHAEMNEHKGKPAYRLLIPEYYGASCLDCHGEPKGEKDITGGKKEGGKLDEVGGAISVVIYVK